MGSTLDYKVIRDIRSAVSQSLFGRRCAYLWVTFTELWPNKRCTSYIVAPLLIKILANVCLRSWILTCFFPQDFFADIHAD